MKLPGISSGIRWCEVRKMGEKFVRFEAVAPNTSIDAALNQISKELEIEIGNHTYELTIFDRYFFKFSDNEGTEYAEILIAWLLKNRINRLIIYSAVDNKEGAFLKCLELRCTSNGIEFCYRPEPKTIHDRYWVLKQGEKMSVVSVGTSFNGLGKKLCSVNRQSPGDAEIILNHIEEETHNEI